ncbi:hypothetical protein NDU88_006231 [Pleurodeles waltl]|uniref:Uncharacterized protein n=1 Tax=Pleurodeles waltl TaxID=8319 RepID=A0AAV7LRX2_PLEWA|nr:hypothetical protein NDU88_006231 [Pleurodeles waltl]
MPFKYGRDVGRRRVREVGACSRLANERRPHAAAASSGKEAQLIKAIAEQRRRQQQSGTRRGGTETARGVSGSTRIRGPRHGTLHTSAVAGSKRSAVPPPRCVPDGAEGLIAVTISRLCPARAEPPGT